MTSPLPILKKLRIAARGVIHVGASDGQEVPEYLAETEAGLFIEPLDRQFEQLQERVRKAPRFRAVQAVCSATEGEEVRLNVASNNGESSSILAPTGHKVAHSGITFDDVKVMRTSTLDAIVARLRAKEPALVDALDTLVLDVQGAELMVLTGAADTLAQVRHVYSEVSLVELYEGNVHFYDLIAFLKERGFYLVDARLNRKLYGDALFTRVSEDVQAHSGRSAVPPFEPEPEPEPERAPGRPAPPTASTAPARRATGEKLIRVQYAGGLANRMIQYMLARGIQQRVPGARIVGGDLPEWAITAPEPWDDTIPLTKLSGHVIPFDEAIAALNANRTQGVLLRTPSMRLDYFERDLKLFRQVFALPRSEAYDFDRSLVLHVRLNRMFGYNAGHLKSMHKDYPIVPLDFYEQLIARSELAPIFVGEFGDDPVSDAYRARFPHAQLVRHDDPMDDFRLIYSARNVAISPSSFSWLASWLSPWSRRIHLPILGFLNPEQRPDAYMLPTGDTRYRFYDFPVEAWAASADQVDRVIHAPTPLRRLTPEQVRERYAATIPETPPLPEAIVVPAPPMPPPTPASAPTLETLYRSHVAVLLHVGGAAGTPTLRAARAMFGQDRFLRLDLADGREGAMDAPGARDRVACVSLQGRIGDPRIAALARAPLYFAAVRNPTARLSAFYDFMQSKYADNPIPKRADFIGDPATVVRRLIDSNHPITMNEQCAILGGDSFEYARAAVKRDLVFATAVETIEDLVPLLGRIAIVPPPRGSERHPETPVPTIDLPPDLLAELQARTAEDCRLYQWLLANREALIERAGARIDALLAAARTT